MATKTKRWHHPSYGVVEGELVGFVGSKVNIMLSKPIWPYPAGEIVTFNINHLTEMKEKK